MGFALYKYDLTIVDPRTREPITTGCYVFVYDAGTKTLSTIYSNDALTARTNPITRTAFASLAKIEFYAAAPSVDIFVADDRGNTTFLPSVAPTDHTVHLNRDGVQKCFVAPYIFNAGGTETDTGLDFPLDVLVKDLLIEVVTTDATETIDIGLLSSETNGDADGFIKAMPISAAGFIRPFTTTDTTTEDYVTTPYWGALIGVGSAGSSTALHYGQAGGFGHIVTGANARSLTYTPSTSDTGAGYIYVFFRHLR